MFYKTIAKIAGQQSARQKLGQKLKERKKSPTSFINFFHRYFSGILFWEPSTIVSQNGYLTSYYFQETPTIVRHEKKLLLYITTNLATPKFNSEIFLELPWTKICCQKFTGKEQGKYEYERAKPSNRNASLKE